MDLKNERGIFVLTSLRKILDQLIYNDMYEDLDEAMSDSNIDSMKNKNVRNHLFMVYGIMNSIINGKGKCIDIQIYDIVQAFDSIWLEDCIKEASIFILTKEFSKLFHS